MELDFLNKNLLVPQTQASFELAVIFSLRNEKIKPESLLHVIGFCRQATLNANWFKDLKNASRSGMTKSNI